MSRYSAIRRCNSKYDEKGAVIPTRSSGNMGKVVKTKPTIESSLMVLESGANLDFKFSAAWCERILPNALDVYLKSLPPSYPTSLHKSQLEKTLHFFNSRVRGHAVTIYAKKLKHQCEAIWHSGRQLCDAESLTGKPCIHQVHDVVGPVSTRMENGRVKDSSTANSKGTSDKLISKPHSSGVVFLHACACGRSRKLRKDPFDFETANVTFFRNEELLPSLVIPSSSENPSFGGSPWRLVRLGMSRCYQPDVGLVQSGFLPMQKFLSYWDIPLMFSTTEGQVDTLVVSPSNEDVAERVSSKPHLEPKLKNKSFFRRTKPACGNLHGRALERSSVDRKSSNTFGNSDTKKGFIDSTSKANYGGESAFPPLPEKQEMSQVSIAKLARQQGGKEKENRSLVVQDDENAAPSALSTNDDLKKSQPKSRTSIDTEEELVSNLRDVSKISSDLSLSSVTKHV